MFSIATYSLSIQLKLTRFQPAEAQRHIAKSEILSESPLRECLGNQKSKRSRMRPRRLSYHSCRIVRGFLFDAQLFNCNNLLGRCGKSPAKSYRSRSVSAMGRWNFLLLQTRDKKGSCPSFGIRANGLSRRNKVLDRLLWPKRRPV